MTVRHGRMHQNTGRLNVRHDGHQVDCLMRGRLFHLQRIGKAAMIIARIRHTANDRDRNLFNTVSRGRAQSTVRIRPVVLQLVSFR